MTEPETIDYIKTHECGDCNLPDNNLEKQTPKKATFIKTVMGLMVFQCNACGKQFFAKTNLGHYCTYCGQKLRAE